MSSSTPLLGHRLSEKFVIYVRRAVVAAAPHRMASGRFRYTTYMMLCHFSLKINSITSDSSLQPRRIDTNLRGNLYISYRSCFNYIFNQYRPRIYRLVQSN